MHGTGSGSSWRAAMDPLDQRLIDAGAAWRRTQPEPPDLDRMVVALRRPTGPFTGRLMYAFLAGLLLMAAIFVAPGVGGFLPQFQPPLPVAPTASPSAAPSEAPETPPPSAIAASPSPSPSPSASAPASDRDLATDLV